MTDAVNPGQSVSSYEYDQLNRLTKATTPNWALQWTYDEFGSRLTQTKVPGSAGTPPEISLSYNETTNRITTAGFTYDLNGNLTALPGLTVAYDVFDRAVTINSSTAKYDAFGRRIFRQSGSTTRVYFYDLGGRLLAEYNLAYSLGPIRTMQYFAGQRLGDYTDRIGNVRYSRSTNGWRHYYPFGEEITGTAGDTYKFADLYRDADTGLDYAVNRYYASSVGRFLRVDPWRRSAELSGPQSFNKYAYVQNDPINFSDPLGLFKLKNPPPSPDPTPGGGGGGGTGSDDMQTVEGDDPSPEGGGGAEPPRLDKNRILNDAKNLTSKPDCGNWLVGVAHTIILDDILQKLPDELTPAEQEIYDSITRSSIMTNLENADWVDTGLPGPRTRISDTEYFVVRARANFGGNRVDLFNEFFDQSGKSRAQTMVHESMHLTLGFTDIQLAKGAGVFREGMDNNAASKAFHDKLKDKCK